MGRPLGAAGSGAVAASGGSQRGRKADFDTELRELGVDLPGTPRILERHAPDEVSHFLRDARPAGSPPGAEPPVEAKALPVPAHDRLGLGDDQRLPPARAELAQQDPEGTIQGREPGSRARTRTASCGRRASSARTCLPGCGSRPKAGGAGRPRRRAGPSRRQRVTRSGGDARGAGPRDPAARRRPRGRSRCRPRCGTRADTA